MAAAVTAAVAAMNWRVFLLTIADWRLIRLVYRFGVVKQRFDA
jgi:hypothetical protein